MNGQERASAVKWGVIGIGLFLTAIAGLIAWVQINFGPTAAVISVGSLFGILIFLAGIKTTESVIARTHQNTNYTLETAAGFVDSIEQTRTAYARGQNAAQTAQAQITVLDYKHQLQQQAAQQRMLTDARQQWEVEQARLQPQAWPVGETVDADSGPSFYE